MNTLKKLCISTIQLLNKIFSTDNLTILLLILFPLLIYSQTNTVLENLGEFSTKTVNAPNEFRGSAVYNNYLYLAGDGLVYIYNIENPEAPVFIKTIPSLSDVERVWTGETYLFAYDGSTLKIFSLADPENPEFISDYESGVDLHKVDARGSYMFVLYLYEYVTNKEGSFEIVDISDPANPQLQSVYKPENHEGRDFCFSADANRVFVAHYNFTTKNGLVREIDYTDPTSIQFVREKQITMAPINIAVSNSNLFVFKDAGWVQNGPSTLEAYQIGDNDITELESIEVSSENSFAGNMHVYGNSISLCLLTEGLKTYTWDVGSTTFQEEEFLNVPNASQTSSFVLNSTAANINQFNSNNYSSNSLSITFFYFILKKIISEHLSEIRGEETYIVKKELTEQQQCCVTVEIMPEAARDAGCQATATPTQGQCGTQVQLTTNPAQGWILNRVEGTLALIGNCNPITVYFKEEVSPKVYLTTSIDPADAAGDGCTVSPPPGIAHEYSLNSTAVLDADAATGWEWDKWTGSLSGVDKPQDLLMDNDKEVTANFQPILVLSLNSPDQEYLCITEADEELTIGTANIFVDGVDWQLSGLAFSAEELVKADYTEAWIQFGATKLLGNISTDADGYINSISFSPSVVISEGSTLNVRFYYKFNFPASDILDEIPQALTEVMKYKISINVEQVNCEPIPDAAKPGVKLPQDETFYSNIQTLASVWNVSHDPNIPFASIGEAVVSPQTVDNDVIEVCPGVYYENIDVIKPLTIRSRGGRDVTIVNASETVDFGFELMAGNSIIEGFTIQDTYGEELGGISVTAGGCRLNDVMVRLNEGYGVFVDTEYGIEIQNSEISYNGSDGIGMNFSADAPIIPLMLGNVTLLANGGLGIRTTGDITITGINNRIGFNGEDGMVSEWGNIVIEEIEVYDNKGFGIWAQKDITITSRAEVRDNDYPYPPIHQEGGIHTERGNIQAKNITVTGNDGPGVAIDFTTSNLNAWANLENVTILYNELSGIRMSGDITIRGTNNHVNYNGEHGVVSEWGNIEIEQIEVSENEGFGIWAQKNVTITEGATIKNNDRPEPPIHQEGGIHTERGNIIASNITVTGNDGPGVAIDFTSSAFNARAYLNNVTILGNTLSGIRMTGNITINGTNNQVSYNGESGVVSEWGNIEIEQIEILENQGFGIWAQKDVKITRGATIRDNDHPSPPIHREGGIHTERGNVIASNITVSGNDGPGIAANYYSRVLTSWANLENVTILNNALAGIRMPGNISIKGTDNMIGNNGWCGIISEWNNVNLESIKVFENQSDGIWASGDVIVRAGRIIRNNSGYGIVAGGNVSLGGVSLYQNLLGGVLIDPGVRRSAINNYIAETGANGIIDYTFVPYLNAHLTEINSLTNSDIQKNMIYNNLGDGIKYSGENLLNITNNNIYNNSGYGVNNMSSSSTLNAQNNWWGDSNGPEGSSGDGISGNVDFSNWRNSRVSVVVTAETDTVVVASGCSDSVYFGVQNWDNFNDILDVSIVAELPGWIGSSTQYTLGLQDSLGAGKYIYFEVPAGINANVSNKIKIIATSQSDANQTDIDLFYVYIYEPLLTKMNISPDSVTMMTGDSLQFFVSSYDQYGNEYEITPQWEASIGEINSTGFYKSTEPGTAEITATDLASGTQTNAFVVVTEVETQLAEIKIIPDSVTVQAGDSFLFEAKGFNQFGFPYEVLVNWSTDCGSVTEYGLFTADSTKETCLITAEDTSTGITANAKVYVEGIVSVDDELFALPTKFKLFQNYPNPFNPVTTIKFGLPVTSQVRLEVFNILGERVSLLIDEVKNAGYHQVEWDSRRVASGIYFYRITMKSSSNTFVQTKKLVLLR